MKTLEEALKDYKTEIKVCAQNKLNYATISLTLSIPDIVSSLECDSENKFKNSKNRYKKWIDKYFLSIHNYDEVLKSGDIYALRCAFLHNGIDDIDNQSAKEVINSFKFFHSFYNNTLNIGNITQDDRTTVLLDIKTFSNQMCESIDYFCSLNKENNFVKNNIKHLTVFLNDRDGFSI